MSTQELLEKINKLSPAKKQEVEDFIDFIIAKSGGDDKAPIEALYGIMKGKVKMSDDFDEPMEDFKEYM